MKKHSVGLIRYKEPIESVREVVDLCGGLKHLPPRAKVFIKPNIVFWTRHVSFPKWGVVTTSRVVEDVVILLKEHGIEDITIGEGPVLFRTRDHDTPAHAFETLGYHELKKRYGVNCVNVFQRPFEKVRLEEGIDLNFNEDILHSDFVVNLPVLKTHSQTIVSLGIKNLKGALDVASRKKCHNPDPDRDLHYFVSRLAERLGPTLTIIDGIYTLERGPAMDGKPRKSDILVASPDMLSADLIGARLLGHDPADVPHLVHAARNHGRPMDLSDITVVGEDLEKLSAPHEHSFSYSSDGTLPRLLERMGVKGLAYPGYDTTLCTYCFVQNGHVLAYLASAWQGEAWDNVEILSGKKMQPTPGKQTVLLGKCLYDAYKDHPDIDKMVAVKTCPPAPKSIIEALRQVGIDGNPAFLEEMERTPGLLMKKYEGKPEFDESFFTVGSTD